MLGDRNRKAARGVVHRAEVALPLLLFALCGFAGSGERVSGPCRIPDSQPLFSKALERGVKESATLEALLARLSADERVTLHFALGDLSPGLRARARVRLVRHRACRGDCLLRLEAKIVVGWSAPPKGRVAAAAHELVHLLRLLHGSADEGRGSPGEAVAERIERRVLEELSSAPLAVADTAEGAIPREAPWDEILGHLRGGDPAASIRVEQVRRVQVLPAGRGRRGTAGGSFR